MAKNETTKADNKAQEMALTTGTAQKVAAAAQDPSQAQTPEVLRLPFTAKVSLADRKNRDDVKEEYVRIMLDNPFPGEPFDDVELACKWRQDKGVFDWKAKKALKLTDELTVEGYFTVDSFNSKQLKRRVHCVGVRLINPFFKGELDLKVRNVEQSSVLSFLLSDVWGVKLSRYAEDLEPVTDIVSGV